jgi:hypothetical protein
MPIIVVKTILHVDNLENTHPENSRHLGHSMPRMPGSKKLSLGPPVASSRQDRSAPQWATVFFACRVASRNLLIARCPKTDIAARDGQPDLNARVKRRGLLTPQRRYIFYPVW